MIVLFFLSLIVFVAHLIVTFMLSLQVDGEEEEQFFHAMPFQVFGFISLFTLIAALAQIC